MGGDRLEGHLGQHDEIIGCHRRRIVPDVFVQPGHVIQFVHLPLNAAQRGKGTVFFAAWESPGLAVKLSRCYFSSVSTITAKQLHQETKAVLNQLEAGNRCSLRARPADRPDRATGGGSATRWEGHYGRSLGRAKGSHNRRAHSQPGFTGPESPAAMNIYADTCALTTSPPHSSKSACANWRASKGCRSSGCSPTPMNLMGRPSSFWMATTMSPLLVPSSLVTIRPVRGTAL